MLNKKKWFSASAFISLLFTLVSVELRAEVSLAKCQADFASFDLWLKDFHQEALVQGISEETWQAAAPWMVYDPSILHKDQQQGGFYKSFLEFAIPRAHSRLERARKIMQQNSSLFDRIERDFGVPGEILVAFWGMETDFATKPGKKQISVLRSMTTLAYDCRRAALFRKNLLDALRLIENHDVTVNDLVGQWAGEMSGLQLTPSNYYKFAIDYDGDGRRNIIYSVPDMLASGANMFRSYGWRLDEPYLLEVRVPREMAWEEADLTLNVQHPMSYWAQQGIRSPDGSSLDTASSLPASLLLPMGRLGPSFLAFPNFRAMLRWNASLNNAMTASYLAYRTKNLQSKPMSSGQGVVDVLTSDDLRRLQMLLQRRGYDVGTIDGFLGTKTRLAVKDLQLKWGLPADAYPTKALIKRLEGSL